MLIIHFAFPFVYFCFSCFCFCFCFLFLLLLLCCFAAGDLSNWDVTSMSNMNCRHVLACVAPPTVALTSSRHHHHLTHTPLHLRSILPRSRTLLAAAPLVRAHLAVAGIGAHPLTLALLAVTRAPPSPSVSSPQRLPPPPDRRPVARAGIVHLWSHSRADRKLRRTSWCWKLHPSFGNGRTLASQTSILICIHTSRQADSQPT